MMINSASVSRTSLTIMFETQDKKIEITTTSFMPFADFEIRTLNVKNVCDNNTCISVCLQSHVCRILCVYTVCVN